MKVRSEVGEDHYREQFKAKITNDGKYMVTVGRNRFFKTKTLIILQALEILKNGFFPF